MENPHIIIILDRTNPENASNQKPTDDVNLGRLISEAIAHNQKNGVDIETLAENVWQTPLHSGLPLAYSIKAAGSQYYRRCKVLLVPQDKAEALKF